MEYKCWNTFFIYRNTSAFWTRVVHWRWRDSRSPTCQFRPMELWILRYYHL